MGTNGAHVSSKSSPCQQIPHRAAVYSVVAFLIVLQPLQYLFIARFGEPYPALTMPQFAGTMTDSSGAIRIVTVAGRVSFDDNSTEWISTDTLLSRAPVSHRTLMMDFAFGPPRANAASVKSSSGLIASLKTSRLLPGLVAKYKRSDRTQSDPPDPRTREWLKLRLHDLYPSRNATAISFIWYQELYRPHIFTTRSRRQIGAYDINLCNAG
jgi:hypothetical protein